VAVSSPFLSHGLQKRIVVTIVDVGSVHTLLDDFVVNIDSSKSCLRAVLSNSVSAKLVNLLDVFEISNSVIFTLLQT
jgi:hypothetical protein